MAKSKLRVLQINKYHYLKGGSDRIYLETSEMLTEHGHIVSHFSTKNPKNQPSKTSQYFVDPPDFTNSSIYQKLKLVPSYLYSSKSEKLLSKLIEKEQPDIAHIHIFFGELSLSVLSTLKRYHIPIVMTLHDFKLLCPIHSLYDQENHICERCSNGRYYHAIKKKCNKKTLSLSTISALESYVRDIFIPYESYINHFIAVSEFTFNKHLQFKTKLTDKISILHNFTKQNNASYANLKSDYFIYFGRLSREKGLNNLIQAFAKFPSISLYIVGEGPEESKLKQHAKFLNIQNVTFLGYKNDPELEKLIGNARFSIFPSESYESFGLGIVESFTLGTPVLASAIGGMKELIKNDITGFLFEPSNPVQLQFAISKASSITEVHYENMVREAQQISGKFSKENHYKQLISLYHTIIDSNEN
ncbi:MAG: glycosyltransferase [Cyclobacteriaceae bacterium]